MDLQNLYAFGSDEGKKRVPESTGFTENPRGGKFRYKLVLARRNEGN